MDAKMHNHIERTRSEASHSYEPRYTQAMELVEFLTKTFGGGVTGIAASFGEAQPHELKPIPNLSSEHTINLNEPEANDVNMNDVVHPENVVKRGRGRPRKTG